MKNPTKNLTRRQFVSIGVVASLAGIPAIASTRGAAAAGLPRLDEADSTAKALSYVHDASRVDGATRGGDDRICLTCRFYTDATAQSWGPCSLFPGKAVNANGWCKGWVARAS